MPKNIFEITDSLLMDGRPRSRTFAGCVLTIPYPAVIAWQVYSPSVLWETTNVKFWEDPTVCRFWPFVHVYVGGGLLSTKQWRLTVSPISPEVVCGWVIIPGPSKTSIKSFNQEHVYLHFTWMVSVSSDFPMSFFTSHLTIASLYAWEMLLIIKKSLSNPMTLCPYGFFHFKQLHW